MYVIVGYTRMPIQSIYAMLPEQVSEMGLVRMCDKQTDRDAE